MEENSLQFCGWKFTSREASSRSLDDSGLAVTPHCRQPIIVQHSSDVTRRHDNSSPESTSSSSHESGIKSTTDSSSPEPQRGCHWQQHQQQHTDATDDVPLDLSVTSSLPWRHINNDESNSVHRGPVMSRCLGNDSRLSTTSTVDDRFPLLSNVQRCYDNGSSFTARSFVEENSPLLSGPRWSLPVLTQSPPYNGVPVIPPGADNSIRLPESAKQLLTSWYETHVRHPYPQPDELSQLVMMTGQSRRKILKWLANRRARTGNTLTHNGSVHPRKIIKIRQLRQLAAETGPHHPAPTARRVRLRSSRYLPESVVEGLRRWYDDHLGYPYPTDAEKRRLADELGTTVVKVTNWFANKRNRMGHSKHVRQESTSSATARQSTFMASPIDWRHHVPCLPQSLPASTFAQMRYCHNQGHLS